MSTYNSIRNILGVLLLLASVGCGGGGGASSGGSGPAGGQLFTLSSNPNPAQIFAQSGNPQVLITLNYNGPATDTFTWDAGTLSQPFGPEGGLQTTSGQPFPTGPTTLRQAVYVGNPKYYVFGNIDQIIVLPGTLSVANPSEPSATLNIPLVSDYLTLPSSGGSAVVSLTTDKTLYHPGDTITATYHLIPGSFNTSFSIGAPVGFVPTKVTMNGSAVTFPIAQQYPAATAPFNVTLEITIPTNTKNEFPVYSPKDGQVSNGESGPWLSISGSGAAGGWFIGTPFFIHS